MNYGIDHIEQVRIIDCILFNDEFNMLDFRLKEISEYVDYIVLVEGNKTWSIEDKPFHFNNNKHRYNNYSDKIVHIMIDDFPETDNPWVIENFSRNAISRGLDKLNLDDNDIIIISDCDEIFDIDAINRFANQNVHEVMKLRQDLYFYNLKNRFPYKFELARVARYKKVKEIGVQRMRELEFPILEKAGWHFSYFFDIEKISKKIKTYAHQEYNKEEYTNIEHIKECIEKGEYLYENIKLERVEIEENNYLPKNYKLLE